MFQPSHYIKGLALTIVSVVLLFFDFYSNTWSVAEPNWFRNYQRDSESLVLGRLVKSRQDGICSAGGLIGLVSPDSRSRQWFDLPFEFQYEAYLDGRPFGAFTPYQSQIGGQGIAFSFLDKVIPLFPQSKLALFRMLTALLSAVILTLIVRWFFLEFGLFVAVAVLTSIFFSQWLVVFGRNLFWCLWAFYAPMLMVMYCLRHDRTPTKPNAVKFIALVFTGFLLKVFFTGYEYITTTLIMMVVPVVFYCVLEGRGFGWFLKYTLLAVFASGFATILSLVILCFQIASINGSFPAGVHHIIYSLMKRTYAETPVIFPEYAGSLTSLAQICWIYLKGSFFDIPNYFNIQNPLLGKAFLKVRYCYLILVFFFGSWFVLIRKNRAGFGMEGLRTKALVFSTWFSMLAPLSWYIIFKQHSAIHTHMSFVVWQMPFTMFGFALCGLAVRGILRTVSPRLTQPTLLTRPAEHAG